MENKLKSTLVIGVSIIITALILGTAFKNRNENLDTKIGRASCRERVSSPV